MDEAAAWPLIESLYRARFPQFERVARAITGDRDSALEAVQEGFADALRRSDQWAARGSLEGWVWRCVVNRARKARTRAVLELPLDGEHATPGDTVVSELAGRLAALPERQARRKGTSMKHPLALAGIVTARGVRSLVVVALVSLASAGMATASGAIVLGNGGDPHEGVGQADFKTMLVRGTVYTANTFPLALKIHAPTTQWGGVQLESGNYRFIQLGHSHTSGTPTLSGVGYITLESAKAATPSAAKTLANLRATPHMRIGPTKAVKVAGLTGKMFDAAVTGSDLSGTCPGGRACPKVVSFAPFRKNQHCGFCGDSKIDPRETLDVKAALEGQLFRVIVVSAHRKVIVIYIESIYAIQKKHPPSKIFPTFLPYAQKMLAHISFS